MRKTLLRMLFGFLLLLSWGISAQAQGTETKYTFWIGSHYTDLKDYSRKVGEYDLGKSQLFPEAAFKMDMFGNGNLFKFYGNYYDEKNAYGQVAAYIKDRFNARLKYRSYTKNYGQDLLTNMETREIGGGKMVTHDIQDSGAVYNTDTKEFEADINALLYRKHNMKLSVNHKSTFKSGDEQKISANHCFSCHLTSKSAEVDQVIHQITAGLQGDIYQHTVGYEFGYRSFKSNADEVTAYYDPAKHPVNGSSAVEFGSRMVFDDTTAAFGTYPETEKISHRLRLNGEALSGKYAGSIGYSRATNKITDLVSTAWTGNLAYAKMLTPRTRLIIKIAGVRLMADNYYVDLPTYRDGRPGPQTNFDYLRRSSLNRADGRGSIELLSQISEKVSISALAGYNFIDRYEYPEPNHGSLTRELYGQFKLKYRKGLKYSSAIKYRYEITSNPFINEKGLFEYNGRENLTQLAPGFGFIFYWQREAISYQEITTLPTNAHLLEWNSDWQPNSKFHVNMGFKGKYDENNDLDSLDVLHWNLQPNFMLNYTPDMEWSLALGGTYNYSLSRGPVAVALFDG